MFIFVYLFVCLLVCLSVCLLFVHCLFVFFIISSLQVLRLKELLARGIGVHHSGILPIMKEVSIAACLLLFTVYFMLFSGQTCRQTDRQTQSLMDYKSVVIFNTFGCLFNVTFSFSFSCR